MEADGLLLVVTRLDIRYRRPIRYDDIIEVRARVDTVSRVKIRHAYDILVVERDSRPIDPEHADSACAASTELACLTRAGRPTELPAWLRSDA